MSELLSHRLMKRSLQELRTIMNRLKLPYKMIDTKIQLVGTIISHGMFNRTWRHTANRD